MSKKGTTTFIVQRATAVFLIPAGVWLLFAVVSLVRGDAASAQAFLASPVNGFLFGAFVILGLWHMRIGMSEIIVDYIHGGLGKALRILNWIAALVLIAGSIFAIYQLSFAG